MAHFQETFKTRKKGDTETWVKRLNKAGYKASFKAITDSDGNIGHGPGSMGYRLYVEGEASDWHEFIRACQSFEPERRRRG